MVVGNCHGRPSQVRKHGAEKPIAGSNPAPPHMKISAILHQTMTDKPISRQRAYQLRRVAEGMCGYCSSKKPLVPGTERCKKCTVTNRKKAKARYRKSGAS